MKYKINNNGALLFQINENMPFIHKKCPHKFKFCNIHCALFTKVSGTLILCNQTHKPYEIIDNYSIKKDIFKNKE